MKKPTRTRRKSSEDVFLFKPFSVRQKQLLYWWKKGSLHYDCFMVIADGAIRSGKTIATIISFLLFSQETFSGENFIIAGKTIGALKRNVIVPMLRIVRAWGWKYTYNRSGGTIVIGTNTYYLFGASTEASQDTLQGLTAAGAYADEAALLPWSFIDQMIGRCSVEGKRVFLNCNPGGPFHPVKTELIDKAKEKGICCIHFEMQDNLTLSERTIAQYKTFFTGVFYKRYIEGLWVQASGLIYSMFDQDKHTYDEMPADVRQRAVRYCSIDYGTANPMVYLDIFYDMDSGDVYVDREYYYDSRKKGIQKSDQQYGADLVSFVSPDEVARLIIDPSAASFKVVARGLGYIVKDADNDFSNGVRDVASLFTMGKLKINRRCKNTIKELFTYIWDAKAAENGTEKPVKQSDHAMDALRYFIKTIVKMIRMVRQ